MQRTFWSGQNIRERLDIVLSRHAQKASVTIHLTVADAQALGEIIAEDMAAGLLTAPLMKHSYRNVHRITTPEARSFVAYENAKAYLDVDVLEEA
ncbi:MAG TPA: hypothetical protein VG839_04235 [Asticcacaulis sp.]|nr:hypothetical protein [Asticcacaulis sp.]